MKVVQGLSLLHQCYPTPVEELSKMFTQGVQFHRLDQYLSEIQNIKANVLPLNVAGSVILELNSDRR